MRAITWARSHVVVLFAGLALAYIFLPVLVVFVPLVSLYIAVPWHGLTVKSVER